MNSLFFFKNYIKKGIISDDFYTFALSNSNNIGISMSLRHFFLCIWMTAIISPSLGQTEAGSSIVSRTVLSDDGLNTAEHCVYDNGLGDVIEEVQSWPGTSLPDLVVRHEYDEFRRRTNTWLPITSSSGSGFISGSTVAYQAQSQYSDTAPFTRMEFDGFLPAQPSEVYKAGENWQYSDKKTSVTYSEYVGSGMCSPEDGYIYITANTAKFLCTRTEDEDGCWSAEYTDLNGRLIISETSQGKTYYMYNPTGDVTHVIPPMLSDYLFSAYGTDSEHIPDTDEMMQKYAYIYRYDNQRHCIYKKLPGCEPVYYVYDRAGSCILSQDGIQRQRNEWTYTIPDKFGRPCISGICSVTGLPDYTSEPLHTVFVYAEYDGTSAATGGYTVYNLSLSGQTLFTAAYYDDYSFIGHHGVPSSLTASSVIGITLDLTLGQGLQTGAATAVLKDGGVTGYTYSAMYYDSRYNVAQVKATNHVGGVETISTNYSYTGKPLSIKAWHDKGSESTLVKNCTYTYDDADRLTACSLLVAKGAPSPTATITYEYDDLGRLSRITRPFTTSVNPDVTYTYDLHGWTKGITTNCFREELFYADGPGSPCYNGNISSMRWKNGKYSTARGYKFTYDNANRLTMATYGEGNSISNFGRYSERQEYDAHGNARRIYRYGKNSSNSYGLMDNLSLTYDGNRLTGVSETAADYDATGTFEYKRAKGSQYIYDANGSLVADKSRGIAYITYDPNNNPQTIYFTNGCMTKYTYSATGQKLSVVHYIARPNITWAFGVKPEAVAQSQVIFAGQTDYLLGGNLILRDGAVRMVLFDGGYASATRVNYDTYNFSYLYYNRDHLGSNREVVNARGDVVQVTNYYPFGAPYADADAATGSAIPQYKYNGKELDVTHGLNTYDYGARQLDPILGRWDRMDPLAEKYPGISPYVYCLNNPVKNVDTDGRKVYLYATTLPGLSPSYYNPLKYATHTFLVVTDSKDMPQAYYAYGSEYPGAKGAFNGRLMKQNYSQDLSIIRGGNQEFLKARIEIVPPNGMSSEDFDKKVIDVANAFGNNEKIKYSAIPTSQTNGNCNTSTSTILLKSGVSPELISEIKEKIPDISTGFDDKARPWTIEEQDKAVEYENMMKTQEIDSKMNMFPFHP